MKAIYALYADGREAQRAVNGLRLAGVSDRQITVISSAPMEDFEFSRINSANHLWRAALGGALVGLGGSTWLTTHAEQSWPMVVGNMAIVAWWPNLIVMFELTFLGAILASVAALIVTAGLGRRTPSLYDPAVTVSGKILVGVEDPGEDAVPDVERALLVSPGVVLRRL